MSMQNKKSTERPKIGPGSGPFGGRHMAMMGGDAKASDFKGTMANLVNYLGKYRRTVLIVLVFAVASTAANIVGPKILGKATTRLFEGLMAKMAGVDGAAIDFDYIAQIA